MAIAFGAQIAGADATTLQATHAVTLAVSSGDLVVVLLAYRDDASITSVVGSVNGAYTVARSEYNGGTGAMRSAIYYFQNSGAGTETITVTTGANARGSINASRWTGAATTGALDQVNGSVAAAATAHNPGSITTTGAGLIITSYSFSGDEGAFTQSGFTGLTASNGGAYARDNFGYRIVTGSTTDDGDITITNSLAAAACIASFNEASSLDPIRLIWRQ